MQVRAWLSHRHWSSPKSLLLLWIPPLVLNLYFIVERCSSALHMGFVWRKNDFMLSSKGWNELIWWWRNLPDSTNWTVRGYCTAGSYRCQRKHCTGIHLPHENSTIFAHLTLQFGLLTALRQFRVWYIFTTMINTLTGLVKFSMQEKPKTGSYEFLSQ